MGVFVVVLPDSEEEEGEERELRAATRSGDQPVELECIVVRPRTPEGLRRAFVAARTRMDVSDCVQRYMEQAIQL